jgi:protocatechuate 3,4-dioxygenase alpha subunit
MPELLPLTPSQTVGPFLAIALPWPDGPDVVAADAPGAVRIHGHVYDGHGDPVPDALVETWQADVNGRFVHPDDPRGTQDAQPEGFRGFGRCPTDANGQWHVVTVKPGPLPTPDGDEAPHIDISVFARGLLDRVVTRLYFPDDAAAHGHDPVLSSIGDTGARATLVAAADGDALRFDIHLQGADETVFFDI